MDNEYKEYSTFTTTTKNGDEVEMAVVDEFEFEKKLYVVASLIEGDEIQSENQYIYRAIVKDDDFSVEKIGREFEYNRIAKAYMEMEEDHE